MEQLQQLTVACTICDSPSEYHCITCGETLCSRCRDTHLKNNGTKHHQVLPNTDRVESNKRAEQCSDHPDQKCLRWCARCDKAVCSECIVSKKHVGHEFMKIATKVEEEKKVAQEDFGKYSELLAHWENALEVVQKEIKAYRNECSDVEREISKQADEICSHVRSIESRKKKNVNRILNSEINRLKDQETTINDGIKEIKEYIKQVEDKLKSEDAGVQSQSSVKCINLPELPKRHRHSLAVFSPGIVDAAAIDIMLGNIDMELRRFAADIDTVDPEALRPPSESGGISDRQADNSSKRTGAYLHSYKNPEYGPEEDEETSDIGKEETKVSLLPTATVITSTDTFCGTPDIACTESGQAWVKTDYTKLTLMDRRGAVKQTVDIDFNTRLIAIAPKDELLITDCDNVCIKSISKKGKVRTLFKTEWKPHGICWLKSGDVMVTFYEGKVIQYSKSGKVIRELHSSLFKHPSSVAQNKVNQHIYICDGYAMLVFDTDGRLQYKYTGPGGTQFNADGVCTDQTGHVFTADYRKHRVHVLDKNGRFLQYMLTKAYPYNIDTDNEGYAWIAEYSYSRVSRVKVCKYKS